ILGLVMVQAGGFALSSSTRGAIIPALVGPELVPAANTMSYTAGNVGSILGPLVAGALVTIPHGYAAAYGLDAVLFTASLWATFRLPAISTLGPRLQSGLQTPDQ